MRGIVSASSYRRLIILDILFSSDKPVSKKRIVAEAECRLNTLKQDIIVLNDIFPEDLVHIIEVEKKLFLNVRPDINFDYLVGYMITKSDLFEISLSIFKDEQLSPDEWTSQKFVGLTNYYAKLKEMDAYLSEGRLVLNSTPLQILGYEMNIRFHFFHLFSKCFPYSGWIIEDFDFETIDMFIKSMESNLQIFFSLTARVDYAIAIGVSLSRIKQGYTVDLHDEADYMDDLESYYEAKKIDFSSLEEKLGASLAREERHLILLMSSLGSFSYLDHSRIEFRMSYHETYRSNRYEIGLALASIIKGQVADFDGVTAAILDYLTRFTFVEKKHLIVDIDYFSKQKVVETRMTQAINDVLTNFGKRPGYTYIRDNKSIISSYIHDLFTFVLLNEAEEKRLHVKVISKNGYFWEIFLKSEIRKYYAEEVVIFCEDLEPKEHEPDCDVILSDFPMKTESGIDVLVWHIPPTERDLLRFKRMVYKEE